MEDRTKSMEETVTRFNEYLLSTDRTETGPVTATECKDWGLTGNDTDDEIQEAARELWDAEFEARCEAKESWRYEH